MKRLALLFVLCCGCGGPSAAFVEAENDYINEKVHCCETWARYLVEREPLKQQRLQIDKQIAAVEKDLASKGAGDEDYSRLLARSTDPSNYQSNGLPKDHKALDALDAEIKRVGDQRKKALDSLEKQRDEAFDSYAALCDSQERQMKKREAEVDERADWVLSLIQAGQSGGATRESIRAKALAAVHAHLQEAGLPLPEGTP